MRYMYRYKVHECSVPSCNDVEVSRLAVAVYLPLDIYKFFIIFPDNVVALVSRKFWYSFP